MTPDTTGPGNPVLVVGIGASAGGVDACRRVLDEIPSDSGLAFVVVLHLGAKAESHLAEVLGMHGALPVVQVTRSMRLEPDHVYVIAPNTSLRVEGGELHPTAPPEHDGRHASIDGLFSSLAESFGRDAVGVILSGLGSDGSVGLADIGAAGGLCIAQDPRTAEHDAMPGHAIAAGLVDAVASPEAIGGLLLEHARERRAGAVEAPASPQTDRPAGTIDAGAEDGFGRVTELFARRHCIDVRDYKQGTLRRQAQHRMELLRLGAWSEYAAYVKDHPEELDVLRDRGLVRVTRFFRDSAQWEHLEREVVPRILQAKGEGNGPIRIWSAGCATGEEAYGLAMIFLEQLERRASTAELRVFATDVSEQALAHARAGVYPRSIAQDVSPRRLARFFIEHGEAYQIAPSVREKVTVVHHDLLSDPPFSRLDLIGCRNLFIYLELPAQEDCLRRFHFALLPHGVLWLGNGESIRRSHELFRLLSSKHRLYEKLEGHRRTVLPWNIRPRPLGALAPFVRAVRPRGDERSSRLTRAIERFVLTHHVAACVVIDRAGHVLHMFGPTAQYLVQPQGEVRLELLSWAGPDLEVKLRVGLRRALEGGETVVVEEARVQRGDHPVAIECTIEPIPAIGEELLLVTFRDVVEPPRAPSPAEGPDAAPGAAAAPVQALVRELQEARAELRHTLDDAAQAAEAHRVDHEELVSLNEELQSTNEELLSLNEELETTKEEALSLNEELEAVNHDLAARNARLHDVNLDLENLLEVTPIPTIFLDRALRVRRFTSAARQVLGLAASDVDRPLEHVELRVGVERLRHDAAAVLEHLAPVETEVRGEDGRRYLRRMVPFRADDRVDGVCITFVDVTAQMLAAEKSEEARFYAESIARSSRLPFIVLDHERRVVSTNEVFHQAFGAGPRDLEGRPLEELGAGQWDIPELRALLDGVLQRHGPPQAVPELELERVLAGVGRRILRLTASPMECPGREPLVLLSIEDVTQLREAQSTARRRAEELEQEQRRKDEFLAMLGHELRNPLAALANGVSILQLADGDPAKTRMTLPMLVRQTTRMKGMLDQLLDVSRAIAGKIELDKRPVDLVEVAIAAMEAVRPMIEAARHRLVVSLPAPKTSFVLGDSMRLVQVVENLLVNAAKYTNHGGTIWLTVTANDGESRITVRDDGIGIDAGLLEHVFGVFTQASQGLARARGGLGLGLPLARLLVTMHGGRIEAFSAGANQGSEFVVHLPRLVRAPTTAAEPPDEPRARRGEARPGRRVLVVDDERDAADALVDVLKIHGHEAKAVHDGRAALEAVPAFRPELVLLDLGLPDLDGYEVAKRLRAGGGEVQQPLLVALSGYQRDPERLREAGFDEHLIKPLDYQRLVALVAERWPLVAPQRETTPAGTS